MATKKKKASRKRRPAAAAASDQETNGEASSSLEDGGSHQGQGEVSDDSPAGKYDRLEDLPEYHQAFAHAGADSYAIVPHDQEEEAHREGTLGRWENSRDGHFVVSITEDAQLEKDAAR